MNTDNTEAQEYFTQKSADYYRYHYEDITSKTKYPSLYLRHRYTLEMLGNTKGGKALDIGCGSGAMARELLDRGFDVTAADISQGMLDATRKTTAKHPRAKHITFTQQDIEHLTLPDNTFDVIICTGVIEYLKSDDKACAELARVLKPGGVAFVSTQNRASLARFFEEALFLIIPRRLKNKIVTVKQHRTHTPWQLDREMRRVGLTKEDFAYHHFYPLPIPLDRIFPRFCVWAGKQMERWHKKAWAWTLATGFVVQYRKAATQDNRSFLGTGPSRASSVAVSRPMRSGVHANYSKASQTK